MTIDEIKDFLREKPGYLKKGSGQLAILLEAPVEDCKNALKEVRKEFSHPKIDDKDDNLILKSRWQVQKKGGETKWLESYKNVDFPTDLITKEDWVDIFSEVAPLITVTSIEQTKTVNKTLIIWTSDKHIGASIPSDSLYKREYDKHIFHKRMAQVFDEAIKFYNIHGKFEELIIADLGDSLDGFNEQTTRGGHRLPQNLNNKEAAKVHFFTHKWFYESFINVEIANKIKIVNVTNDNHSGDFGWQANFALQQYGTLAWPNVEYVNQEEFIGHIIIYNRAYIITHGKDKKNRMRPMPLKINSDTESHIMDYAIDRKISNYDLHLRKGDIHVNDLDCSRKKMTYWNIGSVFGASDWIMDNFSDTVPSCVFEVVEKDSNNLSSKVLWLT